MWQELSTLLQAGDIKALARSISLVENEQEGYLPFLQQLPCREAKIIGITGPPGAGKSTLVDVIDWCFSRIRKESRRSLY